MWMNKNPQNLFLNLRASIQSYSFRLILDSCCIKILALITIEPVNHAKYFWNEKKKLSCINLFLKILIFTKTNRSQESTIHPGILSKYNNRNWIRWKTYFQTQAVLDSFKLRFFCSSRANCLRKWVAK